MIDLYQLAEGRKSALSKTNDDQVGSPELMAPKICTKIRSPGLPNCLHSAWRPPRLCNAILSWLAILCEYFRWQDINQRVKNTERVVELELPGKKWNHNNCLSQPIFALHCGCWWKSTTQRLSICVSCGACQWRRAWGTLFCLTSFTGFWRVVLASRELADYSQCAMKPSWLSVRSY